MRFQAIETILAFVTEHPESYASLAVCRRAIDPGLAFVTQDTREQLESHLEKAPDDEVEAYYYIVN